MATDGEGYRTLASLGGASGYFRYCALGLTIEGPVACPGFFPATADAGRSGVKISFGSAPTTVADPIVKHGLLQVDRYGGVLFHVPRVARYGIATRTRSSSMSAPGPRFGARSTICAERRWASSR